MSEKEAKDRDQQAEGAEPRQDDGAEDQAAVQGTATATETAEDTHVQQHDLPELEGGGDGESMRNVNMLIDISVPVVVELGATQMQIRDILQLQPGSIIELDKMAGDPVDLKVRGKLIAQGEVVVLDESFAVRITRIVLPEERLESLRDD